jgi:hypothetical protein
VGRFHALLDRGEGVLDRLAPLTQGLRVHVETTPRCFDDVLMLP